MPFGNLQHSSIIQLQTTCTQHRGIAAHSARPKVSDQLTKKPLQTVASLLTSQITPVLEGEEVLFGEAPPRWFHLLLQALPPAPRLLPPNDGNSAYHYPHKEADRGKGPVLELPFCEHTIESTTEGCYVQILPHNTPTTTEGGHP